MDTELARTFLTIASCGSFLEASERLNVTQSTVSTRVRRLEDLLGRRLFVRSKSGARLTDAGRRFHRYAAALLRTMQQARDELGSAEAFAETITIGARFGLWERFLVDCIAEMNRALPSASLRAEVSFEATLTDGVTEGKIDIALMFTPEARPGIVVEHLFDERLVFVQAPTAGARSAGEAVRGRYVAVDWGPEFSRKFLLAFPDAGPAFLNASIGWLGLGHVLRTAGSGYFPLRLVAGHLAEGALARVPDAPEFRHPVYMVYSRDDGEARLAGHIGLIRRHAATLVDVVRSSP